MVSDFRNRTGNGESGLSGDDGPGSGVPSSPKIALQTGKPAKFVSEAEKVE
jgi:hypothetical protein